MLRDRGVSRAVGCTCGSSAAWRGGELAARLAAAARLETVAERATTEDSRGDAGSTPVRLAKLANPPLVLEEPPTFLTPCAHASPAAASASARGRRPRSRSCPRSPSLPPALPPTRRADPPCAPRPRPWERDPMGGVGVDVEEEARSSPARARIKSAEPEPSLAPPTALILTAASRVLMTAGIPPRTFGMMAKSLPSRITGWRPPGWVYRERREARVSKMKHVRRVQVKKECSFAHNVTADVGRVGACKSDCPTRAGIRGMVINGSESQKCEWRTGNCSNGPWQRGAENSAQDVVQKLRVKR